MVGLWQGSLLWSGGLRLGAFRPSQQETGKGNIAGTSTPQLLLRAGETRGSLTLGTSASESSGTTLLLRLGSTLRVKEINFHRPSGRTGPFLSFACLLIDSQEWTVKGAEFPFLGFVLLLSSSLC